MQGVWGRRGGPSASDGPFFSGPFFSRPLLVLSWHSACCVGSTLGGEEISLSPWWGCGNGGLLSPSGSPGPGPAEQTETSHNWRQEEFVSKGQPWKTCLCGRRCHWFGIVGQSGRGGVPPGRCRSDHPYTWAAETLGVYRWQPLSQIPTFITQCLCSQSVSMTCWFRCGPDVWVSQPGTVDIWGGIDFLCWGPSWPW